MLIYPGRLIVFEGPDMVGKTVQIDLTAKALRAKGHNVLEVREPGFTPIGESIRTLLKNPDLEIGYKTQVFLFLAARAELYTTVIDDALRRGKIILCDRGLMSSLVYQGELCSIWKHWIVEQNEEATDGIDPDLLLVLQATPETILDRKRASSNAPDRYDPTSIQEITNLVDAYTRIVVEWPRYSRTPLYTINANCTVDEVHKDIMKCIEQFYREDVLE